VLAHLNAMYDFDVALSNWPGLGHSIEGGCNPEKLATKLCVCPHCALCCQAASAEHKTFGVKLVLGREAGLRASEPTSGQGLWATVMSAKFAANLAYTTVWLWLWSLPCCHMTFDVCWFLSQRLPA
jgi:hypothetical protein